VKILLEKILDKILKSRLAIVCFLIIRIWRKEEYFLGLKMILKELLFFSLFSILVARKVS